MPYRYAEELRDRVEAVGVPYVFYPLEGVGHGSPDVEGNTTVAAQFFYDQLWGQIEPPTDEPTPPSGTPGSPPEQTLFLPWLSRG